jgi:hypothetical protein
MEIPDYTFEAIQRYVADHIPPGDFLRAVLTNDLMGAMERADDNNREALFEICSFIYSEVPSLCWGSEERVRLWLSDRPVKPLIK